MKLIRRIILACLCLTALPAQTATIFLEQIPTAWRLENYPGGGVVAYFTGSSCQNGKLSFPPNATENDKNRFWSLVMAAKVSGKRIGVAYNDATSDCQMLSFFFMEE